MEYLQKGSVAYRLPPAEYDESAIILNFVTTAINLQD